MNTIPNKINDILEQSIIIGSNTKFNVRFYEFNTDLFIEKSMTYIELGSYLIMNNSNIACVSIRENK